MAKLSNAVTETHGRAELPATEWHRLLAADRRYLTLEILSGKNPPTDLEALATELAAREDEKGRLKGESLRHVKTTLHHLHLPLLAEVDIIDYDLETHQINPETVLMDAYRQR